MITSSTNGAPHPTAARAWGRTPWRLILAAAGLALAGVAYAVYDPSPVAHFRSPEGQRAYVDSYTVAMQRLPPPRRTLDVSTAFGSVRVYEFGTTATAGTTPVVLLPGRSSGVPMWSANLPDLAQQRTVFALDGLGDAGMSVQTRAIRDGADQTAWLEETLAQLRLPKVHLVGHSFGGWLAANFAVRQPSRIATLTLIEPVFVFQGLRWQIYAWSLPAALPFLPASWRERMLSEIGGSEEIDPNDPMVRMIADATLYFAAKLPLPEQITAGQLDGLRMPVYAALGGKSSMHDAAAALAVARSHVRDLRAELWPDASHSLPMEQPERLDRELLDFMAAHEHP